MKESLEETTALLARSARRIEETETRSLLEARGMILAADFFAPFDQPPFAASLMDGYALRGADVAGASEARPVHLAVIDEVCAGHAAVKAVGPGQAVRIMTGAPIPEGADCVAPQEDTDCGETRVAVCRGQEPGDNIRPAGERFRRGDAALRRGAVLGPEAIGILAGFGLLEVAVVRRPRVLLLTSGDELLAPGEPPAPGKIHDSNMPMLTALLRQWGAEPFGGAIVRDEAAVCADYIRRHADRADMIVSAGGVSVGKKDIMHEVVDLLGARRVFRRRSSRAGFPLLAALYRGRPMVCAPGKPQGALAAARAVVRPVLAEMSGRRDAARGPHESGYTL